MMTVIRYIVLFLSIPAWCSFYIWVHAVVRTCNMCTATIRDGRNILFKILAFIFFLFCSPVFNLIFCVMGVVYLFMGPCSQFAESREETRIGYLKIVQGDNFAIGETINGIVKPIFC